MGIIKGFIQKGTKGYQGLTEGEGGGGGGVILLSQLREYGAAEHVLVVSHCCVNMLDIGCWSVCSCVASFSLVVDMFQSMSRPAASLYIVKLVVFHPPPSPYSPAA